MHTPAIRSRDPVDPARLLRRVFVALTLIASAAACATGPAPGAETSAEDATARGRQGSSPSGAPDAEGAPYVEGVATLDGTGRFYMGREIALVMGHLAAGWLERGTREQEERTDLLLNFLFQQPASTVADIGVGTGYFALPWARHLADGRVLGVDIQQEMLDMLAERAAAVGATNVVPVLGTVEDPGLPVGEVDVVLIVDAYHEFSHPREMLAGIARGLRPGGRLVLVEYRGEDPDVPIKELHKMTERQAIREVAAAGLEWVGTEDFLPQQHVLVFEKPAGR